MTRWYQLKIFDNTRPHRFAAIRRSRVSARRGGFTLAEVAVALAIFVFGALAVVRIFPPALDVIRNSESRATATLLAQSTIERQRRGSAPDAVYGTDYSFPGAFAGTVNRNSSLPAKPIESAYVASALSRFRNIVGEKQIVRSDANASNGLFVLTQYPYLNSPGVGVYKESEVTGLTVTNTGVLYKDGVQFSDATANTDYYISYRWESGGNLAGGVVEECVRAGTAPVQVLQGTLGASIVEGSVTARRRERIDLVSNAENMTGYVPLGTPAGIVAGDTVTLDYTVVDWRWLVDDKVPTVEPNPGDVTDDGAGAFVKPRSSLLPVRFLDEEVTTPIHTMLTRPGLASAVEFPIQNTDYVVNSKRGRVTFDLGGGSLNLATRSRVVYRATEKWAHQISVAARSYVPAVASHPATTMNPQQRWREYSWLPGASRIYFHPNEAGKSVVVTFRVGSEVMERLVTVEDKLITAGSASLVAGFESSTHVSVLAPYSDPATGSPLSMDAVLAVRGMSVHARTAWINGDRYSQAVVADYRPTE